MSSWTSRLHKSHDPPRRNSEAPAAGASSSLDAFDSYLSIPGLYEVSRGDQLLSDNASVSDHEDTRTRSHHGRSISHHLLNAFNPGKKGGKEGALSRSKDEPGKDQIPFLKGKETKAFIRSSPFETEQRQRIEDWQLPHVRFNCSIPPKPECLSLYCLLNGKRP